MFIEFEINMSRNKFIKFCIEKEVINLFQNSDLFSKRISGI